MIRSAQCRSVACLRQAGLGLSILLLVGCATSPIQTQDSPSVALDEAAGTSSVRLFDQWVGEYVSLGEPPTRLLIEAIDAEPPHQRAYHWAQTSGVEPSSTRHFVIELGVIEGQPMGTFAPTDATLVATRRCPMSWQRVTNQNEAVSLFATTDIETCQFSQDGGRFALLKEMAFDGRRLEVADQIIDVDSQQPTFAPTRSEFIKVQTLQGSVGVREGDQWRVSKPMSLPTNGRRLEAFDAAGMSLGVAVALRYERTGDTIGLKLSVSELDDSQPLAQAWAGANSATLAVSSPRVQAAFGPQAP